jgi:hypothetical protein
MSKIVKTYRVTRKLVLYTFLDHLPIILELLVDVATFLSLDCAKYVQNSYSFGDILRNNQFPHLC